MNTQASIARPVVSAMRTMGSMSRIIGARRAVGTDLQLGIDDLAAQGLDVGLGPRARAGEPDVGGLDAQRLHQVQDAFLGLDRGIHDRRRLQPVAQRLVVEHQAAGRAEAGRAIGLIPVVDQFLVASRVRRVPTILAS